MFGKSRSPRCIPDPNLQPWPFILDGYHDHEKEIRKKAEDIYVELFCIFFWVEPMSCSTNTIAPINWHFTAGNLKEKLYCKLRSKIEEMWLSKFEIMHLLKWINALLESHILNILDIGAIAPINWHTHNELMLEMWT